MRHFRIKVNGQVYDVEVEELGTVSPASAMGESNVPTAPQTAATHRAEPAGNQSVPLAPSKQPAAESGGSDQETITAPLPGAILDVCKRVGDEVQAGEVVLILEAMKMENEIAAPVAGRIAAVHVEPGQTVDMGQVLVTIEP